MQIPCRKGPNVAMKKPGANLKTIVASTAVIIFALFSSFAGTYAWFMSVTNSDMEASAFSIVGFDAQIDDIGLYKFDYERIQGTSLVNYLAPERGSVNNYPWVEGEGRNKFGILNGNAFTPVEVMNVYDPASILIRASDLRGLNCNAIYKITVSTSSPVGAIKAFAEHLTQKGKQENELYLTDMLNFDLFLDEDLETGTGELEPPNPLDQTDANGKLLYYPSYKSKFAVLTEEESIYYKISYLSSLKQTHAHFYGGNQKPARIQINDPARELTLDEHGQANIYINVNYEPTQLSSYATRLGDTNIKAVFDYVLSLTLE